jgi:hypothetical protein
MSTFSGERSTAAGFSPPVAAEGATVSDATGGEAGSISEGSEAASEGISATVAEPTAFTAFARQSTQRKRGCPVFGSR